MTRWLKQHIYAWSEGNAGCAAGRSSHSDGGAAHFVTESIEGLGNVALGHRVLCLSVCSLTFTCSQIVSVVSFSLSFFRLLLFFLSWHTLVIALGLLLLLLLSLISSVILAVVVSTEGERWGTAWLLVDTDWCSTDFVAKDIEGLGDIVDIAALGHFYENSQKYSKYKWLLILIISHFLRIFT